MKILRGFAVAVFVFAGVHVNAQVEGIATGPMAQNDGPRKGLHAHIDYAYGVINNRYEVERQYKSGVGLGVGYRFGQWFMLSGVLTQFQRHDALSLRNCQAWSFDLDGQLTMRLGESDLYFRMIYGMGFTDWKGYYVGPNLNDNYHYYYMKLLKDKFYTANMGWGFSHFFFRQRLEGFSDFRIKFAGDPKVLFSIRDTQFHIGVRYAIEMPERKEKNREVQAGNNGKDNGKDGNGSRKTNREKNRRVYKWMKNRK